MPSRRSYVVNEPFSPQLALFMANRPLLAVYREFAFPDVPARTGLLPATIDDVRTTNREILPIAIDIALSKAAVVVYDSGGRSRLPLEYVRVRRGVRPVIVVTAPLDGGDSPEIAPVYTSPQVSRPSNMGGWPLDFVAPLLKQIEIPGLSQHPRLSMPS